MPAKVRRALWAAVASAVATDVLLAVTGLLHGHIWLESLPAFGAAAGLISALGIAGLAKLVGALLLTRGEDYYG